MAAKKKSTLIHPPAQADPTSKAARLKEVEGLMSLSVPYTKIVREISEKHKIVDRTVRADIKTVMGWWEEDASKERPVRRNQCRANLRIIMQKALGKNNFNAAVSAVREMMRLDGLLDGPTVVVNNQTLNVSTEDPRADLKSVLDRIDERTREASVDKVTH